MDTDSGVPNDTLFYQRIEATNTLSDRCVILSPTYYSSSRLWNPPWFPILSGLPASALPVSFRGSGIPVSVRDITNNPYRANDFATLAASYSVGVQQFRRLSLPYFVREALEALGSVGGLRRDLQIIVGGAASGVSGWSGGAVYQVLQFADDSSEAITQVVYCKKV